MTAFLKRSPESVQVYQLVFMQINKTVRFSLENRLQPT